jgi:membrane-associated phospholipid phosphatase
MNFLLNVFSLFSTLESLMQVPSFSTLIELPFFSLQEGGINFFLQINNSPGTTFHSPFPTFIQSLDEQGFTAIHQGWSAAASPWLDPIMVALRNPLTWIPLYAYMLLNRFMVEKSTAIAFVLCTLLAFGLADFICASVLKPWIARPRPCHNPLLADILRPLIACGGWNGTPSNHATNHFALASFWFWAIGRGKWRWLLWIWAIAICLAQIYVGKHYPLDVLLGAALGTVFGVLALWVFEQFKKRNWLILKNAKT